MVSESWSTSRAEWAAASFAFSFACLPPCTDHWRPLNTLIRAWWAYWYPTAVNSQAGPRHWSQSRATRIRRTWGHRRRFSRCSVCPVVSRRWRPAASGSSRRTSHLRRQHGQGSSHCLKHLGFWACRGGWLGFGSSRAVRAIRGAWWCLYWGRR